MCTKLCNIFHNMFNEFLVHVFVLFTHTPDFLVKCPPLFRSLNIHYFFLPFPKYAFWQLVARESPHFQPVWLSFESKEYDRYWSSGAAGNSALLIHRVEQAPFSFSRVSVHPVGTFPLLWVHIPKKIIRKLTSFNDLIVSSAWKKKTLKSSVRVFNNGKYKNFQFKESIKFNECLQKKPATSAPWFQLAGSLLNSWIMVGYLLVIDMINDLLKIQWVGQNGCKDVPSVWNDTKFASRKQM